MSGPVGEQKPDLESALVLDAVYVVILSTLPQREIVATRSPLFDNHVGSKTMSCSIHLPGLGLFVSLQQASRK